MPHKKLTRTISTQLLELNHQEPFDLLKSVTDVMGCHIVHANSFSLEDVVITHMMHQIHPRFKSFVLDTGRLNPETYDVIDRIQKKYQLDIEIIFPKNGSVEKMVKEKGINLFYESVENRKLCCQIRKVEPLNRVLKKYAAWICGLRRGQSPTREKINKVEVDANHNDMIKVNPLVDWSLDQVRAYIKKFSIPYNRLYDQGYQSIGCAPCTRAIGPKDPERAGRWWWENPETKECGLHSR